MEEAKDSDYMHLRSCNQAVITGRAQGIRDAFAGYIHGKKLANSFINLAKQDPRWKNLNLSS